MNDWNFDTSCTRTTHLVSDFEDLNTVQLGYNDVGLSDTLSVASDVLWSQLIRH
jgi:hypothetical protein